MAESITQCEKCGSENFVEFNPEARDNDLKILVTIKAKCNDCGEEFEFSDFSNKGLKMRQSGRIW